LPNLSRTNDSHFQVFPNPSADHIRIVAKQQINEKVTVNILGIKGELIETFHSEGVLFKNQELVSKTTNSSKNKLIPGIYFINIDGPTIHENMKVIVN
jgi:hypothetical protein